MSGFISHTDTLRLALHQSICPYNTNISVIQFSQFRLSPAWVFDGCPEYLAVEWRLGFDVEAQTVRVFRLTLINPIRVSLYLPLHPLSISFSHTLTGYEPQRNGCEGKNTRLLRHCINSEKVSEEVGD